MINKKRLEIASELPSAVVPVPELQRWKAEALMRRKTDLQTKHQAASDELQATLLEIFRVAELSTEEYDLDLSSWVLIRKQDLPSSKKTEG